MVNTDRPWLPDEIDETFDPLSYADASPSPETPIVVTPRGGAREVGRSCYQIDTQHGRYLVDCGLNQGQGEKFPDFRGLNPQSVDAVFLTHAHVDHCGGLPVLENRNLLAEDAAVLVTPPTASIATLMLKDSLKIHQRETNRSGDIQQFTRRDVEAVCDRFHTVDYGGGRITGSCDAVSDTEPAVFQFGNAAHLLGSAWVMIQTGGHRVVFSGDLGGRAPHLPDITPPPEADVLILESTYGATHSHTSMSDARTTLWRDIERALQTRKPVLIPTFAVGRAQTILLTLSERLHTLSTDLRDRVELVIDGMAVDATTIYHEYVTDEPYVSESLVNRVEESGMTEPFLPEVVTTPTSDQDRLEILRRAARGDSVPIIVSPSGMLTGGNSPRYLAEFAGRLQSAMVFLTGYQAQNTVGCQLQSQYEADQETLTVTTTATPFGTDWPDNSDVRWIQPEPIDGSSPDTELLTRVSIPGEWVTPIEGMSGHAAQQGLLSFARTVGPDAIHLIHGPDYAQQRLGPHLAENVTDVTAVTRSRLLTPIKIDGETTVETAAISPEQLTDTKFTDLDQRIDHLYDLVSQLNEEIASARNDTGLSEQQIREIVRDELNSE